MLDDVSGDLLKSFSTSLRPHSEGNNVMSWIGFKHIMYMAEEAVRDHFRQSGLGFRKLIEDYGLILEAVEAEGRILQALKLDEVATVQVEPQPDQAGGLLFQIRMHVERDGRAVKTYSGRVRMALRADRSLGLEARAQRPAELERWTWQSPPTAARKPFASLADGAPRLDWQLRAPYFYCHGNDHLKLAGCLRLLEEADARFCEQQGIGVGSLLRERRWIPAVPAAKVRFLDEVLIDEELHVVYRVVEIVKTLLYRCEMDVFAKRGDAHEHVVAGEIVHGYAEITSHADWGMVNLDDRILSALRSAG